MGHEYKVGDRVRLVTNGGFVGACRAGMVGHVVGVYDDHGCDVVCDWLEDPGCDSLYFYQREIEPYTDPTPANDHIAQLRAMTEEALSKGDYNNAAIFTHALAQITPKPTT